MLEEIPSSLLMEWEKYYEQEPFGQVRQDFLLGMLVQLVYNALPKEDDSGPISLEEILYPKAQQRLTQAQQVEADLAFMESLVASGKVIDLRKKRGK
jgi:hypothetical protein